MPGEREPHRTRDPFGKALYEGPWIAHVHDEREAGPARDEPRRFVGHMWRAATERRAVPAGLDDLHRAVRRGPGPATHPRVLEPREVRPYDVAWLGRPPPHLPPSERLPLLGDGTEGPTNRARQAMRQATRRVVRAPGKLHHVFPDHLGRRQAVHADTGRKVRETARVGNGEAPRIERDYVEAPAALDRVAGQLLPPQRPDRGVGREVATDEQQPGASQRRGGRMRRQGYR